MLVAIVIKQLGLQLYMLTQHIEAAGLHLKDIVLKAAGRCGQEYAVREIALIKQAVTKQRLAVEANDRLIPSRLHRNGAKSEV